MRVADTFGAHPELVADMGRTIAERKSFFRTMMPAADFPGADRAAVEKFYDWTETPEEADFALVRIESPLTDGGYTAEEGDIPVSLQYRPYTAANARQESIGQGDFRETDAPNRSYRGKTCHPANESDLDLVLNTRKAMGQKPVIVSVRMLNPSGLLPVQLPRDMDTVEAHCEDKPLDLEHYVDSKGNAYDFGFGLSWSGVIEDERTRRYPKP